jgi:non-ribosomal peptide synthetase component E (peptide arylation enzyme)
VDLIWLVPLAVLVIGLVPVLAVAGRIATELHAFRGDVERWTALRPAVVEVRDDADLLRRRAAALRAATRR